ncbi:MAG TPA: hypothetical protein VFV38_52945 [Ktedonobacteraceae bacterium]|nr:hypothetical protein [Ktedonobacteraceae bacterium]
MSNKVSRNLFFCLITLALLPGLTACGEAQVNAAPPQQVATINPGFQAHTSPVPTTPPYRCGAWTSNNAPGTFSTITVYARLTRNTNPAGNIAATATVHFQNGDANLGQATSDAGGYVSFTLPLQGRQPANVPATVDVTFSGLPQGSLHCTPAFFTPR